jgi:uncharacterized protein (TIGR02246 family)
MTEGSSAMPVRKPAYASPQDVEAAFYEAIARADLEAMMSVWAEDEEIVCTHPGGMRLTGYAMVREAWRRIFEGSVRLQIDLSNSTAVQTPFAAVHTVIEQVSVAGDASLRAPVVATNVFLRTALGWRMVLHHASPVPPDSLSNSAKTLH